MPAYMYEKKNLIHLVLFTALFALVFINLYKPFSSPSWYKVSEFMFFIYSGLVILTGVLVVVISRIIMYFYGKNHEITYTKYAFWILAEIFFMSLFYTIYVVSINPDRNILESFKESLYNTGLVLLIPYSVSMLYLSWKDKEKQLSMISLPYNKDLQGGIISFYDDKGELRLSIQPDHLYYIEAADNYVFVWYINKGVLSKFMLRITLKALEKQFADSCIMRCHRSYMVNLERVKIIRREKDGVYLEFGHEKIKEIQISKTYVRQITEWFIHHN
jgi:hypothetical protein